jgi:hypothetical protein
MFASEAARQSEARATERAPEADEMTVQADEAVDAAAAKLDALLERVRSRGETTRGATLVRRLVRGRKHSPETNGRPAPSPPPKSSGPNALVVIGAAFALGVLAAKVVDWRSHANARA